MQHIVAHALSKPARPMRQSDLCLWARNSYDIARTGLDLRLMFKQPERPEGKLSLIDHDPALSSKEFHWEMDSHWSLIRIGKMIRLGERDWMEPQSQNGEITNIYAGESREEWDETFEYLWNDMEISLTQASLWNESSATPAPLELHANYAEVWFGHKFGTKTIDVTNWHVRDLHLCMQQYYYGLEILTLVTSRPLDLYVDYSIDHLALRGPFNVTIDSSCSYRHLCLDDMHGVRSVRLRTRFIEKIHVCAAKWPADAPITIECKPECIISTVLPYIRIQYRE